MNGGKAVPLKDALARRSLRLCSCLCLLAGSLTLLLAALQTGDLDQAWRAPLLAAALGAAGVTVLAFFVWRGIAAEGRAHAELSDRHAALVLNEERCKLALEGAGDGVWDWNIADGLAFYSPRARAILGLPAGDSRPRFDGWSRSLHTADAQRVRLELAAHVQGRLPFLQIEAQMRSHRGQGRRLLIRGMVAPERDAAGRPVRVTGTLTDVTERQPPQAAPGTPERPPLRTELDLALAAALGDAAPAPHLPAGTAGAPRPS